MRFGIGLLIGLVALTAGAEQYGAPIQGKNPVTLQAALEQLGTSNELDVLVESKVDKVCEQKGCWLGLRSESGQLHVTFKNEAFFVPASLIGKTVVVEGKIGKVTLSMEETREAVKASGGDPAKVQKPGSYYQLVAHGIEVKS